MLNRRVWGALLAATVTLGLSSTASAQRVERSGATYHVAVCPGPAAAGTARCHAHVVTDSRGNPIPAKGPPFGAVSYTPSDLKDAYKLSGLSSNATVAIVDAYGYADAEADLAVYRSHFSLPPCTTANGCFRKVDQTGGTNYPSYNLGWAQETALDLDMVSAICPTCKILLVEADSNSYANLAAGVDQAVTLGADVVSNSYGGGESGSDSFEGSYHHSGVPITASSGDSGYGVEFPASAPHVTAVGGTSLQQASNTRGWAETAWSGSGSGCSAVYPKQSWQTDPDCPNRTVADVSAVADPNTGVQVYGPTRRSGPQWLVFGGTSVGSPIIAAIYGLQGNGSGEGSDPYTGGGTLFDVISGSNGHCRGSYLCNAVPGYDGPTGLGTPNGASAF